MWVLYHTSSLAHAVFSPPGFQQLSASTPHSPWTLPLSIEEHQPGHIIAGASLQHRAVGIGLSGIIKKKNHHQQRLMRNLQDEHTPRKVISPFTEHERRCTLSYFLGKLCFRPWKESLSNSDLWKTVHALRFWRECGGRRWGQLKRGKDSRMPLLLATPK